MTLWGKAYYFSKKGRYINAGRLMRGETLHHFAMEVSACPGECWSLRVGVACAMHKRVCVGESLPQFFLCP